MTGLGFHVEGPVGQFALGRGAKPEMPVDNLMDYLFGPDFLGTKQTRVR